jgi:PDZ domain/Sel1 repeat
MRSRISAKRGLIAALLGIILFARPGTGFAAEPTNSPDTNSFQWLTDALARNDLKAVVNMGSNYLMGHGVPQDGVMAVKILATAAVYGDSDAKRFMGFAYGNGSGVPQDAIRARDWFESSARDGNAKGQANFGEYESLLSPPDYTNAFLWVKRSAEQGYAPAQYDLGTMYDSGVGVTVDRVEAYKWLKIGADGGSKDAARERDLLAIFIDPSQKQEAERRVKAFKTKSPERIPLDADEAATCPLSDYFEISAKMFGEPRCLIVDTGSFITILDSYYKDSLVDLQMTINTAGSSFNLYAGPDIYLGQKRFALLLATVTGLKEFSEVMGRTLDGILGIDFLKNHVVCFDPDQGVFTVQGSVPEAVKKSALAIPLKETAKDVFCVEAMLNGKEVLLTIDTGNNGSIELNEADWRRVFPKGTTNIATGKSMRFGPHMEKIVEELKSARLHRLTLGTNVYTNLIADAVMGSNSLLGQEFFRRQLCVMDFPNRTLYLVPGRDFNRPDEEDMSGLELWKIGGKILVEPVDKDSPASRAGMAAGDEIISVNGREAASLSLREIRQILRSNPGDRVTIQAARQGKTETFTFLLKRSI